MGGKEQDGGKRGRIGLDRSGKGWVEQERAEVAGWFGWPRQDMGKWSTTGVDRAQ